MRLWSIHPRYLDPQGLTALWRETLLAKAVLRGDTRGYRHHPQLARFKGHGQPGFAINSYLSVLHREAQSRNYSFDRRKIGPVRPVPAIAVTSGQLEYEWDRLLAKLAQRSPALYRRWRSERAPACHPLLRVRSGPIEPWERPPR